MKKKPDFSTEHLLNIQCEQIEEKIEELKIIKDNFDYIEKAFRRKIAFSNKEYFSNSKNPPLNLPRGADLTQLINRIVSNIKTS